LPEFLLLFLVQQQFLTLRLLAGLQVGVVEPMRQVGFDGCWVNLSWVKFRCVYRWAVQIRRSLAKQWRKIKLRMPPQQSELCCCWLDLGLACVARN
jgi:hypothetical protein